MQTVHSVPLSTRTAEMQLASLLVSYPLDDTAAALAELEAAGAAQRAPFVSNIRAALLQPDALDAMRSRYLDLFDTGLGRASLYETEHGRMRGMSKGNDLADIAGFYNAFGMKLEDDPQSAGAAKEMLDHLAVELEFYAVLLLKQQLLDDDGDTEGSFVVADARRKFLTEHLGTFVGTVAQRPDVASDDVYGPVLRWCSERIADECQAVGATPAALDFFATPAEDPTECGEVKGLPIVKD